VTETSEDLAAVAALEEPTRRRLYELVAAASEPVSRDEAAAALGLPRSNAAFHLDRMVEQGLLTVVYARRTGRSGPGAGRPAKLYRRSDRQITVNLPERRYDLAGRLLAGAVERSAQTGEAASDVLAERARQVGVDLGQAVDRGSVIEILRRYGFEPYDVEGGLRLGNCPFRDLAADYPDTVCRMNLHLVTGLLDGLSASEWSALPDDEPGQCCVRLEQAPSRRAGRRAS
jgi:predicted ArsR family transcriptional regulator